MNFEMLNTEHKLLLKLQDDNQNIFLQYLSVTDKF